MPKVYVVNNAGYDYSKASKYGELVDLTNGNVPIFKSSLIQNLLKQRLEDFTEEDFIMLSGPALLNVLATTVLFNRFDTIKVLIFDAKQQDYEVRHINK